LAHAANMKESYESMKLLLGKINYDEFKWKLCSGLQVVARLLGMQLGYTKYCCFLCEWNVRDKKNHDINKLWPKRTSLTIREKNVFSRRLVLPEKIYLPPLKRKLGLMKNFVKGMDKTVRGLEYVRNNFPNMSDAKIKESIFIGLLIQDKQIDEELNETERNAWLSFKRICNDFLAANSQDIVQYLLNSYKAKGCYVSLKIHFLESHLNFFTENPGEVSDEHGERFLPDIMAMEKRYQGKWSSSMVADCCWTVKRDVPEAKYRRKS